MGCEPTGLYRTSGKYYYSVPQLLIDTILVCNNELLILLLMLTNITSLMIDKKRWGQDKKLF